MGRILPDPVAQGLDCPGHDIPASSSLILSPPQKGQLLLERLQPNLMTKVGYSPGLKNNEYFEWSETMDKNETNNKQCVN